MRGYLRSKNPKTACALRLRLESPNFLRAHLRVRRSSASETRRRPASVAAVCRPPFGCDQSSANSSRLERRSEGSEIPMQIKFGAIASTPDEWTKRRKRLSVYYKQLRTICSVLQSIRYLTLLYLILTKIGREVAIFCMTKFHFQLI